MNIGVDIDGVLANFTDSYAALLTKETGIVFPKNSAVWPTEWYWDRAAGVDRAAEKKVWGHITSTDFWAYLDALPGARETLRFLDSLASQGNPVYFITSRPGMDAKQQTEFWLRDEGIDNPTVLIVSTDAAKGQLAKGLKLDVFIDDKPENCDEVVNATKSVWLDGATVEYPCQVFLVDAPYNRRYNEAGVTRVESAFQALERVTETYSGQQLRRAA